MFWYVRLDPGSSPLTRGKPRRARGPRSGTGLIPAHAGKTYRGPAGNRRCRAHPRSRGENARMTRDFAAQWGSSPLTRGKRRPVTRGTARSGLIPAHAGKTQPRAHQSHGGRAHPRSRGENLRLAEEGMDVLGSSPLTRGKPLAARETVQLAGLIPAHAGKTGGRGKRARTARAHPRSRGENAKIEIGRLIARGSSPLTRGKPA